MLTFIHDCPYCLKETTFHSFGVNVHFDEPEPISARVALSATCQHCQGSIVADFKMPYATAGERHDIAKLKEENKSKQLFPLSYTLDVNALTFLPEPPKPRIPECLPADVHQKIRAAETLYIQAKNDADMLSFAGTAYRAALEKSLAVLDDDTDKNLNWRINSLVQKHVLVQSLGDFAHRIRVLGNDATHDDISFGELSELRLFTQLFLQYVFTLPAMIPKETSD